MMDRNSLRALRKRFAVTQATMAEMLGVSVETYRPWESGRRRVPPAILQRASQLVGQVEDELVPLPVLATVLGVHVRTLRQAARDGRLVVTFDQRTYFGKPIALATRAAGQAFAELYYRRTTRWSPRSCPPILPIVPPTYPSLLTGLRLRMGLTQSALAERLGAASKAVVYQWESRRRKPSAVFWARVLALASAAGDADLGSERT